VTAGSPELGRAILSDGAREPPLDKRQLARYKATDDRQFSPPWAQAFFENDDRRRVPPEQVEKIAVILAQLDAVEHSHGNERAYLHSEGWWLSIVSLTSLLLVEERLLEAEHFIKRLRRQNDSNRMGFELNAFLSACRSVTFLLQKEMSDVPGFSSWWEQQREALRADKAAVFFVNLRNFSQKEGRVSVVGSASRRNGRFRWSYRFAGGMEPVPAELLHRDVAECCREHLAKLARVILACGDRFPFATCPRRALTPAGIRSLGITIEDVEELLGFPRGWTDAGQAEAHESRLRALQAHVDGVEFRTIERLSQVRSRDRASASRSSDFGEHLLVSLVDELEARRARRS
jgi:hypothetical protein